MTKLYLNSTLATNNKFTLDNYISGRWKLLSFCFTNNIFNVNDNNNKIYFTEGSTERTATLTNGYYDMNELKTEIQTAINNVASVTFTVSIDTKTNKYTITRPSGNFYFTFGTNTTNSAKKLLGMNQSDGNASSSHTSDKPVDLNTYPNIFVRIQEDNNTDVLGINFFNSSLVINGTGSFSDIVRYNNNDNFDQYIRLRNTKTLTLKIHDLNNNDISLNSDYSIIFEKC